MADSDSQRDSYYNRQRSSLRSDISRTTTRDGRAPSRGRAIDDSFDNLDEIAAAAPIQDRLDRPSGLEKERETEHVERRDGRRQSRQTVDETASSGVFDNLDELAAPPPIQDWRNQRSTFEEERELPLVPGTAAAAEHPQKDLTPFLEYHTSRRASRFATELYSISYLIVFAILGTLARLGVQWLTFYPGTPSVFSVLWANFAGSLLMGFFSEDQWLFRHEWGPVRSGTYHGLGHQEKRLDRSVARVLHAKVKKTIPLYIGLTTGFCGSFTSFSSFIRDIFFALSNDLPSPVNHPHPGSGSPSITSTVSRNGGYSFMAVCAVIILTVSVCYSALRIGAHIAIYTDRITPTLPFRVLRRFVDPAVVFIAWGVWLGAVFMAIWPPDRPGGPESKGTWASETWRGQAIFACVFAPLGCLLRFYLSLKLNARIPSFPLGTFAVNVFGTAVLGMAYDLQHVRIDVESIGGGLVGCQVLQGIMDGFCGTLTTVSTWTVELDALKRGHAYVYGSISVFTGLGMLVVIMGSVRWSIGWTEAVCLT